MAYSRKTHNMAELSEACSRAAHMRHVCRGGRPRLDDLPEGSMKAYRRDLEVFKAYARMRGVSLKQTLNVLAHLLIHGGNVPARPELAPNGWKLIR